MVRPTGPLVIKYNNPEFEDINSGVFDFVKNYSHIEVNTSDYYNQQGAQRTSMDIHKTDENEYPELHYLLQWIWSKVPDAALKFADIERASDGKIYVGFDPFEFEIEECWGVIYSKGHSLIKHSHFPYSMSFCYCVAAPDKCSQLVIEGEEIEMIGGDLVFFLSHLFHWVDESDVDGRCVIAGNIKKS